MKKEADLDHYLFDSALNDITFSDHTGAARAGEDLRDILEKARNLRAPLVILGDKISSRFIVEQAAIAGLLDEELLSNPEKATKKADDFAVRLDGLAGTLEKGWRGEFTPVGGYIFRRTIRGVTETYRLPVDVIQGIDAHRLHAAHDWLTENFDGAGELLAGGKATAKIHGPLDLLDRVIENARKGLSIQRYKGLGEMNPDQLWETTLDPVARTLVQVRIEDAADADHVFSTLMGDVVAPRREFIQDNALKVHNLDV